MVVDAVIAIGTDDRLNMIGIKKVNSVAYFTTSSPFATLSLYLVMRNSFSIEKN